MEINRAELYPWVSVPGLKPFRGTRLSRQTNISYLFNFLKLPLVRVPRLDKSDDALVTNIFEHKCVCVCVWVCVCVSVWVCVCVLASYMFGPKSPYIGLVCLYQLTRQPVWVIFFFLSA